MRRALYLLLAVPAVVAAVACGTSYSSSGSPVDDAGVDGAMSANVDGAPTAPTTPCPAGCLLPPPSGWTGPSTVIETALDGGPGACPLAYPQREADSFHADGGPGTCACTGDSTTGAGNAATEILTFKSASCGPGGAPVLVGVGCTSVPSGSASFVMPVVSRAAVDASASVDGCCATPSLKGTPPPIDETLITSCGARVSNACPNRADCNAVTAPEQPFLRVCIHADGEVACPNTDYPNRFVSYRTVVDGRSCNDCTATTQTGTCGMTAWPTITACQDGTGNPQVLAADGGCTSIGPIETVVSVNASQKCEVAGGGATGALTLTGAVTYCCTN